MGRCFILELDCIVASLNVTPPSTLSYEPRMELTTEVTKEILERRWDEVAAQSGLRSVMGVDLLTPESSPNPGAASLTAFLPLYIVAAFHLCQRCGACCRPNYRKWDKGIVLSRAEAITLEGKCRLIKKNSQHILPYPCQFLKAKGCDNYVMRPYGCRLFPFTTVTGDDGIKRRGIIMLCPAAKDLYINSALFLQDLSRHMESARLTGQGRFDIRDLDQLKLNYPHNEINGLDLAYMKRLAINPYAAA